jgi:hypothetical protein
MRKPKEQAAGIGTGQIWFTNAAKTIGTVPLLGKPHLKAKVDLTKSLTCHAATKLHWRTQEGMTSRTTCT